MVCTIDQISDAHHARSEQFQLELADTMANGLTCSAAAAAVATE